MLEQYVKKIEDITRKSGTETSLQIKLELVLTQLLALYGVAYEPFVNETLKAQGLSQVDSTRPDSLFGHVVLDYKAPSLLSTAKQFQKAKLQIEAYLNVVIQMACRGRGQNYVQFPKLHYSHSLAPIARSSARLFQRRRWQNPSERSPMSQEPLLRRCAVI
jgi:hypothetical protein